MQSRNRAGDAGYLDARGIVKRYGRFTALGGLSFTVDRGEFVSVLGPSGCGKTTILRVVAGLEPQDAGEVRIAGRDVSALPTARRNVGIVFQSYALFPNLTAAQNVAYGLNTSAGSREATVRRVTELMRLVGLEGKQSKYPSQLSGGQQQRVALARAMALSPDILLLDEPLSALDAQVRLRLRGEIKDLQRRLGVTTMMVTHDQEEALTMADRILVMDHGQVVQQGSPLEIYEAPATPFVAAFIGSMNFLPGARKLGHGVFEIHGRHVYTAREPQPLAVGQQASLGIRPEDVALAMGGPPREDQFQARVRHVEYRGPSTRVALILTQTSPETLLDADLSASRARALSLAPGDAVRLEFPAGRVSAYASAKDGHRA
uniref:ABC-type spermidine/putrescine transport system, ATPase component n=1 Tax=Desulfovibrio sp. U5L TaxID=596152 RepID=I2PZR7_9BACT